jgi:hypothetical protein
LSELPEALAAPAQSRARLLRVPRCRGDVAAAVFLMIVGLFFAVAALRLEFGTISLPGPGFFPLVLGLSIAAFALLVMVQALREPRTAEVVELGHRDVLIGLLALIAVCLAFEPLGAFLTLGAFTALLLILIGRVSAIMAALSSIIGMVAVWYIFKVALGLQLPEGRFDFSAGLSSLSALFGH